MLRLIAQHLPQKIAIDEHLEMSKLSGNIERIGPDPGRMRAYLRRQRPVVVEGLFEHCELGALRSLDALLERCGDAEVQVSTNYSDSFFLNDRYSPQLVKREMSLARYAAFIREHPETRTVVTEQPTPEPIAALAPIPDFELPVDAQDPVSSKFFVAREGGHAHLHFDGDLRPVLLYQITGRKRFVLFPATEAHKLGPVGNFSTTYLQNFSAADKERFIEYAGGWHTYLEPGEALFMPPMIWHYVEYSEGTGVSVNYRYSRPPLARRLAKLRPSPDLQQLGAMLWHEPLRERARGRRAGPAHLRSLRGDGRRAHGRRRCHAGEGRPRAAPRAPQRAPDPSVRGARAAQRGPG